MSIKQITQLPASTTLASTDVLAKETSGGTTQKITAEQIATAVKVLESLVNTTEMNAAIQQSTANNDPALLTSFDASKRIVFTPTSGQSQASYGGCWYGKIGTRVYLHIGMTGLTANAAPVTVFTLPAGYRPIADMVCLGAGGASYTSIAIMSVNTSGVVRVNSQDAYARIDMMFDALS